MKKLLYCLAAAALACPAVSFAQTSVYNPATGYAGIGTTSPSTSTGYSGLTINHATSGGFIDFKQNETLKGTLWGDAAGMHVYAASGLPLRFFTDANEKMRILADGKVGIGTNTPTKLLSVSGNGTVANLTSSSTAVFLELANSGGEAYMGSIYGSNLYFETGGSERMRINSSGEIGIGTTAPQKTLEVVGTGGVFRNTNSSSYTTMRLYNNQNNAARALEINYSGSAYPYAIVTGAPAGEVGSIATTGAYPLVLATGNTASMVLKPGGNIGIGTANPDEKLTVNGRVHSTDVIVTNVVGADFVFADDYALRPLAEVAAFVKENKHLPEVAPAAEMQKNGLLLGEMNIKLLQKVEELTLYLIEKEKQLTQQTQNINALTERVLSLEKQLKK